MLKYLVPLAAIIYFSSLFGNFKPDNSIKRLIILPSDRYNAVSAIFGYHSFYYSNFILVANFNYTRAACYYIDEDDDMMECLDLDMIVNLYPEICIYDAASIFREYEFTHDNYGL